MLKTMKIESKQSGFTLIELLVTIAIISVLTGFVMSNLMGGRIRARDGQRKADLRQIQSALEMYRSDFGYYPNSNIPVSPCGGSFTGGTTTYMQKISCDPKTATAYTYTPLGVCGTGSCTYQISACLENANDQDTNIVADAACTAVNGTNRRYRLNSP